MEGKSNTYSTLVCSGKKRKEEEGGYPKSKARLTQEAVVTKGEDLLTTLAKRESMKRRRIA